MLMSGFGVSEATASEASLRKMSSTPWIAVTPDISATPGDARDRRAAPRPTRVGPGQVGEPAG